MKSWIKNGLAISVVVIAVGADIAYEQYVKPYVSDTSVYVATQTLEPNQRITQADLRKVQVPRSVKAVDALSNDQVIVGKLAAQVISQGQEVTSSSLESNKFALTNSDLDVPVVSQWIASIPQTLRRGDVVDISLAGKNQSAVSTPQTSTRSTNGAVSLTNILTNILVEYVRTDSNQEVVNTTSKRGTSVSSSRENGSGQPAELELKLTAKQWQILHQYILENDQFCINRSGS